MRQSWNDVLVEPPKAVEFWLEGFIPKGGITLLYGKYGTYKTPITMTMGRAIATGSETWGLEAKPGKILYVEADTPPQVLKPRIQASKATVPNFDFYWAYPGFDVLHPNSGELDKHHYSTLHDLHSREAYDVVFIDSLRCLHGLEDVTSSTPHRIYQSVAKLFPDASLVFVHHAKKTSVIPDASDDEREEIDAESFSGSQAWMNHATVGLQAKHSNKEHQLVKLSHIKSQAGELMSPLVLKCSEHDAKIHASTREAYLAALRMVPPGLQQLEQDKFVAKFLGVSSRTARRYRLQGLP